jgi:hypothetical protein
MNSNQPFTNRIDVAINSLNNIAATKNALYEIVQNYMHLYDSIII